MSQGVAKGNGRKSYEEIRRVLRDELGFVDIAAYKSWVETARPSFVPTREVIDRLSPDNVDCRAFWRVAQELFGRDPVCNTVVAPLVGELRDGIETDADANRANLRLAKSLGITSFLEENAAERLRVLEVGPGFGSLKHYIEACTRHVYTGIDVFPRIAGVMETTEAGLIPAAFVEEQRQKYSYVISSNVFQHLSARQRSQYYADAYTLLHRGGLFIFNLQLDTGKASCYPRDASGQAWCDHYGQYTAIPGSEIYTELRSIFDILYVTQRYDNLFNFVCRSR